MKLTELEPRWIDVGVFVFLCPHCREWLLCCTSRPMRLKEQFSLFEKEFGEDWNTVVVPMREGASWAMSGTRLSDPRGGFDNLSVTPSIDASASGCWHGFIINGELT